jgi:hypothetical protein
MFVNLIFVGLGVTLLGEKVNIANAMSSYDSKTSQELMGDTRNE